MTASTPGSDVRSAHVALYAGSFDPITLGHLDVLARARCMFDALVLGIGRNPEKPSLFSLDERVNIARTLVEELVATAPNGAPVRVDCYSGLTVEFARQVGAVAILRGIRNIADLAVETQLAITNRQVAGIETVFIVTGEAFAFTSSSLIRQVAALGGSLDGLTSMVPPLVIDHLRRKRDDPEHPLRRLVRDQLMD
jgi:pantetheine-phosphate adenylyltransferase